MGWAAGETQEPQGGRRHGGGASGIGDKREAATADASATGGGREIWGRRQERVRNGCLGGKYICWVGRVTYNQQSVRVGRGTRNPRSGSQFGGDQKQHSSQAGWRI